MDRRRDAAVLTASAESLPGVRSLLLGSYRPEYAHGWGQQGPLHSARIDRLQREAPSCVARDTSDRPGLGPLSNALIESNRGHIRSSPKRASGIGRDGRIGRAREAHYQLARPARHPRARTVQAILTARIDRLPPERSAPRDCAARIGKRLFPALFRLCRDESEDAAHRALGQPHGREFFTHDAPLPRSRRTTKVSGIASSPMRGRLLRGVPPTTGAVTSVARIAETMERLDFAW